MDKETVHGYIHLAGILQILLKRQKTTTNDQNNHQEMQSKHKDLQNYHKSTQNNDIMESK